MFILEQRAYDTEFRMDIKKKNENRKGFEYFIIML